MRANKLTINVNKTCFTIFSANKANALKVDISIDNTSIKQVQTTKYLGLNIDEKLSWKNHIEEVHKKLLKFGSIFFKLRGIISQQTLRTLYFSLVYPNILYGVEIYANCCKTYLTKLNVINNKIIRTILNKDMRTPVTSLYSTFNVLPVNKLHIFNILLLVHKTLNCKNQLPLIFQNYFTPVSTIHNHNTRGHNRVFLGNSTNSRSHKTLKFKGALLYNKIPEEIKKLNYQCFTRKLKNYLLSYDLE